MPQKLLETSANTHDCDRRLFSYLIVRNGSLTASNSALKRSKELKDGSVEMLLAMRGRDRRFVGVMVVERERESANDEEPLRNLAPNCAPGTDV
jgi:hypothetical protein